MNTRATVRFAVAAALGIVSLLPLAAQAHRGWMLPSATVLSGENAWVTIDAAVSNDLFYFEHQPMRLDNLKIFGPDGKPLEAQNTSTGRYRSTFDLKLSAPGTYRISMLNDNANASFKVGTETKRLRGTLESLRNDIPAGAQDVQVSSSQTRMDVFVTSGKPTDTVLKSTGKGLELVAKTHPNDLFAGDTANFGMTIDGKPAAGITVTVIPGGIRYRDKLGEVKVVTDKDGQFNVKWPEAGMYWMNASWPARAGDDEEHEEQGPPAARQGATRQPPTAGAGRRQEPGGTLDAPARRASYTATLEVLAQ